MSRIGKKPIEIPGGVSCEISGNVVNVKGPLGSNKCELTGVITAKVEGSELILENPAGVENKEQNALHGLYRALLQNVVTGVKDGFTRDMKIEGVGYRVQAQGNDLQFHVGFSHPVMFKAPEGIKFQVADLTHFKITGTDKQLVGQVAAKIRGIRPPEPYKGKGIMYTDEVIRRKAGKTGKK